MDGMAGEACAYYLIHANKDVRILSSYYGTRYNSIIAY